jgi:hypothetical protein
MQIELWYLREDDNTLTLQMVEVKVSWKSIKQDGLET